MNFLKFLFCFSVFYLHCSSDQTKTTNVSDTYLFSHQIEELFPVIDRAREYAAIGAFVNGLESFDSGCYPSPFVEEGYLSSFKSKYTRVSAVDHLLSKSDSFKILMINFQKHKPINHTFVINLLEGLYSQGYHQLGIEDIFKEIKSGDCLVFEDNIRVKDPLFGHLIRSALDIGYQIFPIESFGKRDGQQLENVRRKLGKNPKDKILIYCSLINSIEASISNGKTLANKINEELDINPLTVNQIHFTERGERKYEWSMYKKVHFVESSVYVDQVGNSFTPEIPVEHSDIYIFHPRTEFLNNRPIWMENPYNQMVRINTLDIGFTYPIFVYALKRDDECQNSIPYDLVEIKEKQKDTYLFLPKGKFKIIIQNDKGQSKSMKVKV